MTRVVGAIEVLHKDSGHKDRGECVCIFHDFPSAHLHRALYGGPPCSLPCEMANRGMPDRASYRIRERWEKKEYPNSGFGLSWLSLKEVKGLAAHCGACFGGDDPALRAVILLMERSEESFGVATRFICWGELVESPR